jgi:hypothetical protein
MSHTPSRTPSRTASGDREEPDVAEIKKALATGNVKDTGPVGSASKSPGLCFDVWFNLFPLFLLTSAIFRTVLPILCYCTASILMTVVNKVRRN